jgi:hypothetical protein
MPFSVVLRIYIYIYTHSPKTLNNISMKFNKSVAFVTLKFEHNQWENEGELVGQNKVPLRVHMLQLQGLQTVQFIRIHK